MLINRVGRRRRGARAAAVPDATIRARRTFESGDTIITEGSYSGTHTGDLVGPSPVAVSAVGACATLPLIDIEFATYGVQGRRGHGPGTVAV